LISAVELEGVTAMSLVHCFRGAHPYHWRVRLEWPLLLGVVLCLAEAQPALAKGAAPHHATPHHAVPHHSVPQHAPSPQINVFVSMSRPYHSHYYRGRHYGGNSRFNGMNRLYQQQYQAMVKQQQAEHQAFMAKFDANHDGVINGKERGPAEKYLRERRLGIVGPLATTAVAKKPR
jgi:hypothetical protein